MVAVAAAAPRAQSLGAALLARGQAPAPTMRAVAATVLT